MSINFSLRKYKNPVFIETGTYKGAGIRKAVYAGFKKIYSIEIGEKLYKDMLAKFDKEIQSHRVNIILGDSSKCLAEVIKDKKCGITFWLDAHYSCGDTARGDNDVVLLQELDVISKHAINTHTILIDDVRIFGKKDDVDWSEVKLDLILKKLKTINSNYSIHYEHGIVENDVLVAEIPRRDFNTVIGTIEELIIFKVLNISRKIKHILTRKQSDR